MWADKNTGSNLPTQIALYATQGDAYKFLVMARGGGSANNKVRVRALPRYAAERRFPGGSRIP